MTGRTTPRILPSTPPTDAIDIVEMSLLVGSGRATDATNFVGLPRRLVTAIATPDATTAVTVIEIRRTRGIGSGTEIEMLIARRTLAATTDHDATAGASRTATDSERMAAAMDLTEAIVAIEGNAKF